VESTARASTREGRGGGGSVWDRLSHPSAPAAASSQRSGGRSAREAREAREQGSLPEQGARHSFAKEGAQPRVHFSAGRLANSIYRSELAAVASAHSYYAPVKVCRR
jgi:hypothetical protein